jgi:hypothetical protein
LSIICRRRAKFVTATALVVTLFSNSLYGQSIDPTSSQIMDGNFVKWALTQGGLSIVLLVVLWSYRRDLQRAAEAKEQTVTVLMDMVSQNMQVLTKLTAVVESLSIEVRRLEDFSRKKA